MTPPTSRRFYRTIKNPVPARADFLSDEARGVDPPDNPAFRRYWQGLSVFDTLAHARALAERYRRQGDYIAEVTIEPGAGIMMERWARNPGHHTLSGDPDELLARVTDVQPVFPPREAREG